MKVVQLNCVYGYGSTGKIVKDLHFGLLEKGIDSYVYYGHRKKSTDQSVYKLSSEVIVKAQSLWSKISGYKYGGSIITTRRFIKALESIKPDVVHLQCINSSTVNIYEILEYLLKNDIPTVLTLHAEFMYTGGCAHAFDCEGYKKGCWNCHLGNGQMGIYFINRSHYHWERMKNIIGRFDKLVVVGVSEWIKMRAESSPIFDGKQIRVIYNGLDTNIFYYRNNSDIEKIKEKYGLPKDKKIILHVTPNFKDPNKGKKSLIEIAEMSSQSGNDYCFVIVGYNETQSDLPSNIIPLSFISDANDLAVLYTMSHVTLLLSRRETFSMVCAESLCCGTPVIGFRAGAPELISIPEYSSFFQYGDVVSVYKKLCLLGSNDIDKETVSNMAHEKYSSKNMVLSYMDVYSSFFDNV